MFLPKFLLFLPNFLILILKNEHKSTQQILNSLLAIVQFLFVSLIKFCANSFIFIVIKCVLYYNFYMKFVKLDFYDQFCCLASDCKDSCCSAGWQIDVDAKTMQRYSLSNNPKIQQLTQFVARDKHNFYIRQSHNLCPFFCNDGLCNIVKQFGDKYLCDVCKNFPRVETRCGDVVEQNLSFACEQVCNLVLNHKLPIKLVCTKIGPNDKLVCQKQNVIGAIQNKKILFKNRLKNLKDLCKFDDLCLTNFGAEIANCEWLKVNASALSYSAKNFIFSDGELENILTCIVFRHFFGDNNQNGLVQLRLCILMLYICNFLADNYQKNNVPLYKVEALKTFAREFENSNKNLDILKNIVKN